MCKARDPMSSSNLAQRILPRDLYRAFRAGWRSLPWRQGRYSDLRLIEQLREGDVLRVLGGPFSGMRYLDPGTGIAALQRVAGSYEAELHQSIEAAIRKNYTTIINVGCAEGFYAVGMAIRCPDATVWAFDSSRYAQRACRELAKLNNVEQRVKVGGTCDPETLNQLVGDRTFILIDCEGCEKELMDPQMSPNLARADAIVELHDFIDVSISSAICDRFGDSHSITIVDSRERNASDYPALLKLPSDARARVVKEGRPAGMQWAVLNVRS